MSNQHLTNLGENAKLFGVVPQSKGDRFGDKLSQFENIIAYVSWSNDLSCLITNLHFI